MDLLKSRARFWNEYLKTPDLEWYSKRIVGHWIARLKPSYSILTDGLNTEASVFVLLLWMHNFNLFQH